MTQKRFLKPVSGKLVRDPYTHAPLAEQGEWKPITAYWTRQIQAGDCVEEEPVPPVAASTLAPSTTKIIKRRSETQGES